MKSGGNHRICSRGVRVVASSCCNSGNGGNIAQFRPSSSRGYDCARWVCWIQDQKAMVSTLGGLSMASLTHLIIPSACCATLDIAVALQSFIPLQALFCIRQAYQSTGCVPPGPLNGPAEGSESWARACLCRTPPVRWLCIQTVLAVHGRLCIRGKLKACHPCQATSEERVE